VFAPETGGLQDWKTPEANASNSGLAHRELPRAALRRNSSQQEGTLLGAFFESPARLTLFLDDTLSNGKLCLASASWLGLLEPGWFQGRVRVRGSELLSSRSERATRNGRVDIERRGTLPRRRPLGNVQVLYQSMKNRLAAR